jgi:predicted nucleotidyltransferase
MAKIASELEQVIRRFCQELEHTGIRPEQVLLFGSHAQGQAGEGSDIDLIIISPDWARFNRRERLELLGLAAVRIMESVQAQGFTPDEVDRHETGAFWEEIIGHQAIAV